MIKKALAILALSLGTLVGAWAQNQNFTLHNDAQDGTIVELWMSPHSDRKWHRMNFNRLAEDHYEYISWTSDTGYDLYDFRVVFANGDVWTLTDDPINLSEVNDVYVKGDTEAIVISSR